MPRRARGGVDVHDVASFRTAAVRASLLRLAFGSAAVALVVAAAASARGLETRPPGLVPNGATAVVVVDLSLSIEDDNYVAVRRALRRLIAENASIGLVVFSDVPYELLPPGTPASELRPMLRLLVPPKLGSKANPWTDAFRAGTRVSSALELARKMLERHGVRSGSILLVSDLETAPDDVPALTRTVESIRRSETELRVVALSPSAEAQLIFAGLVQDVPFGTATAHAGESGRRRDPATPLPATLLALAGLSLLALAAHERFGGRLALTGGAGA